MDNETGTDKPAQESLTSGSPIQSTEEVGAAPDKPATEEDLKKIKDEMSAFERATLKWTRATFVVVAATMFFVGLQWYEMKTGGATTSDQLWHAIDNMNWLARTADESSKKAAISADAAKSAADTSRDAFFLGERAWVGVVAVTLLKEPALNEAVSFSFRIKNTGNTPAIKVGTKGDLSVSGHISPPTDWRRLADREPAILFQGESSGQIPLAVTPSVVMTEPLWASYQKHQSDIYAHVRIDYADVFGNTHWSEVCFTHSFGTPLDRIEICGTSIDPWKTRQNNPKDQH